MKEKVAIPLEIPCSIEEKDGVFVGRCDVLNITQVVESTKEEVVKSLSRSIKFYFLLHC